MRVGLLFLAFAIYSVVCACESQLLSVHLRQLSHRSVTLNVTSRSSVVQTELTIDGVPACNGVFRDALNATGWTMLQLNSSTRFSDYEQLFSAGFLEGYLTSDLINDAVYNFINTVLNGELISSQQQAFISNQTSFLRLHSAEMKYVSDYWNLVDSLLAQLDGMYEGYLTASRLKEQASSQQFQPLTFDTFYYLTNMGDLEDIQNALLGRNRTQQNCDALVLAATDNKLICTHNTFNIYSLMLRVYKVYDFPLQNHSVISHSARFSSRPGDLQSKDDFYTLDSGLVVMETSLNNYNASNYQYLHYNSVPCWMRVNIANRFAKNASHWASIFSKNRSGTHNNQWFVVDYNVWQQKKSSKKILSDVVWMVEESFFMYAAIDFSSRLQEFSYVASYNVPFNQSIYNSTMYASGYGYTYETDPRALLFKNHTAHSQTTLDIMRVIRSNNNSTGNPGIALSPRQDLLLDNPRTFGGIDGKVVNDDLLAKGEIYMISGPTQDGFSPFSWADWPDVPRRGMPNLFNNTWIRYNTTDYSYSQVELYQQVERESTPQANSDKQLKNEQI